MKPNHCMCPSSEDPLFVLWAFTCAAYATKRCKITYMSYIHTPTCSYFITKPVWYYLLYKDITVYAFWPSLRNALPLILIFIYSYCYSWFESTVLLQSAFLAHQTHPGILDKISICSNDNCILSFNPF